MQNNKQKYLNSWIAHTEQLSKVGDVFLYSKEDKKYEELIALKERLVELIIEASDIEFRL